MRTITARAEVTEDRMLRLDLACDVPPGPVDVVVMVSPRAFESSERPPWGALLGLGREVWRGTDAEGYIRELREDRDAGP